MKVTSVSERRPGHSKLVYDKALRTIVTVTDPGFVPMTATEIQMRAARADEAREQKQREFLQPLLDAHLAVLDASAPGLIANSAEADRVNLLWEKGLLWEDDSGKLSADPPTPKPSRLRELLQRKASSVGGDEIPVTDEMIALPNDIFQGSYIGEGVTLQPEESLYEECLAVQGFPTLAELSERYFKHAATELQTTVPEAVSALARQISTGRSLGKTRTINALLTPKVAVTKEMNTAGEEAAALAELGTVFACSKPEAIYRAMAAVAPVELISAAEDRIAALEADLEKARRENEAFVECWVREMQTVAELESQVRMLMSDKANHDYIGPAKDGKAVADEVHERFHKALGDVATGGVMRPARDQMEKALADAKAKDGKAPQPIRGITRSGDPRIGGWHG